MSRFVPALLAISAALLAGPAPAGAVDATAIDGLSEASGIGASGAVVQQRQTQESDERPSPRELGIRLGELEPGPLNAVTDVEGVRVGHHTVWEGDALRTGVTAILP
ncbi:MAG: P1 family peptidase, partial [Gemmatimonadota bacterium]